MREVEGPRRAYLTDAVRAFSTTEDLTKQLTVSAPSRIPPSKVPVLTNHKSRIVKPRRLHARTSSLFYFFPKCQVRLFTKLPTRKLPRNVQVGDDPDRTAGLDAVSLRVQQTAADSHPDP